MYSSSLEAFGRLVRVAGLAICIALTAGCLDEAGGNQGDGASAGRGSVTIHWTAPTTRTDGSSLTLSQISDFVVYEGTAADDLTRVATVNDGSATEVTLNYLVSGDHYFAVSARDTDGLEGPKSEAVSFTVD